MTDATDSLNSLCDRLREVALPSLGTPTARGDVILAVCAADCAQRGVAGLRRPGD